MPLALAGASGTRGEGSIFASATRLLTEEKELVIRQLDGEGKAVASIARMVGLTRKTIYRALARGSAER